MTFHQKNDIIQSRKENEDFIEIITQQLWYRIKQGTSFTFLVAIIKTNYVKQLSI